MNLFNVNTMYFSRTLSLYCCTLCLASSILSCSKETLFEPASPQGIVSFRIDAGGGQTVEASLTEDSLVVYWPWPVALPETIQPAITLASKASIQPASGTAVPFETGTVYTVKTADGQQRTYHLHVVRQWPPIEDVSKPRNGTGYYLIGTGDRMRVTTLRNLVPDLAQTKAYLVRRETGTVYEMPVLEIAPSSIRIHIIEGPPLDTSMDEGYWLRIENAGRTFQDERFTYYISW